MVDGDVVGGGGSIVIGGEGGEEEAAAGAEVIGCEGVERRDGMIGVDDSEETVARGIDGEAEEGDVGGEVIIGDECFNDAGVRDGSNDALAEGSEEEVLGVWVPGEGFRVKVR